jgi:hypothetical protein
MIQGSYSDDASTSHIQSIISIDLWIILFENLLGPISGFPWKIQVLCMVIYLEMLARIVQERI